MNQLLKSLGLSQAQVRMMYLMGRDKARGVLRGAMIFPGIRKSDLEARAKANGDEASELIAKRDAMIEAQIDFIEEYVNLDED